MDIKQRHVDKLAFTGLQRVDQCRFDRGDRIDAGKDIGDRDACLHRLPVRLAGDRHEAGHALDNIVVARESGIGTGLAEAGNRTIDQSRIDLLKALVIEPVFHQATKFEIFDQHVGGHDQPSNESLAFLSLEIGDDGTFAAIGGMVIGGRKVFPILALDERRTPLARVVTPVRVLHLDDVSAEIGQHLPCPGAGKNAGQVR